MSEPQEVPPTRGPLEELKAIYRARDAAMPWADRRSNIYHPRHPLGRIFRRHNQDVLVEALNRVEIELDTIRILDIGSGYGHSLRHLIELGADPAQIAGVELTRERARAAARANPRPAWLQADGASLPFVAASFDLVLQLVVFSSVLDGGLRARIASEMRRVLHRRGHILWIDRKRPLSGRLAGFSRRDVLAHFPDFRIVYERSVHPLHFRWLGGRFGSLSEFVYALAPIGCESSLFVLRREDDGGGS